jgi:hypothetical protein
MKILFTIITLFSINYSSFSQDFNLPLDEKTQKVTYQDTLYIDSLSKNEIYDRLLAWTGRYFDTQKTIIDYVDKENGRISLTPIINISIPRTEYGYMYSRHVIHKVGYWAYTIEFNIYDSKFHYKISNFYESTSSSKYPNIGEIEYSEQNTSNFTIPNKKELANSKRELHFEVSSIILSLKKL